MALIGLQVVEGIEAGRIYQNISTPVTIGREEENGIQLNDERISRFHAKIQDDSGRTILTDLESTNGTRVNGRPVRMRVLRPGDQITVGRCMLVFVESEAESAPEVVEQSLTEMSVVDSNLEDMPLAFPQGPPPVPTELAAVQAAELSDLLEYIRTEIIGILQGIHDPENETPDAELVRVQLSEWHRLQNLSGQIARYLKNITDPQ